MSFDCLVPLVFSAFTSVFEHLRVLIHSGSQKWKNTVKSLISSIFKQFKKCANTDVDCRETMRLLLSGIHIQFKGFINQL